MDATELAELLTRLRRAGRASAREAIASFASALETMPADFVGRLQREAEARVAADDVAAALPKSDLRGLDARDIDRDKVRLTIEDDAESTCVATLTPDLVRFASGASTKPFADEVVLEDTIVLNPAGLTPERAGDLAVNARITIRSTAKRTGTSFDERHAGAIATEFKLEWNTSAVPGRNAEP
ncbi:MAG TPA: hypothetical protein VKG44_07150 [Candidatus Baltobacteraceae bacterium]|nr:hypothetical protein [Candidatus Baltobacteraceae bacterium]